MMKNKCVENMKQINGDEYTSDTQYWPKSALDDYLQFYSKNTMYKFSMIWTNEHPRTDRFQSIPYSIIFLDNVLFKVVE